ARHMKGFSARPTKAGPPCLKVRPSARRLARSNVHRRVAASLARMSAAVRASRSVIITFGLSTAVARRCTRAALGTRFISGLLAPAAVLLLALSAPSGAGATDRQFLGVLHSQLPRVEAAEQ